MIAESLLWHVVHSPNHTYRAVTMLTFLQEVSLFPGVGVCAFLMYVLVALLSSEL